MRNNIDLLRLVEQRLYYICHLLCRYRVFWSKKKTTCFTYSNNMTINGSPNGPKGIGRTGPELLHLVTERQDLATCKMTAKMKGYCIKEEMQNNHKEKKRHHNET